MEQTMAVGKSLIRKDAWDKVTGRAKFNRDHIIPGILHAQLVTSTQAHAVIKGIDTSRAEQLPGVLAVVTGEAVGPVLTGTFLEDRPIMAVGKVRYYGEPVAVVVAASELTAQRAAEMVQVAYEPLPVVNSPGEALAPGAALVHEQLERYRLVKSVYPQPGSNIANHVKIRKGEMDKGWAESAVVAQGHYFLTQSDHAALEPRSVRAQIKPDGRVIIHSPSQATYIIRKKISRHFNLDLGLIEVHTPYVGGSFGGKAAVQLELIAYVASRAVQGREVLLANSREEDLISSPCRAGLEARVKLGATKEGIIKAAEITYLLDIGAYSDMGAVITKSIASDCTGPYHIENVQCDALGTYTNHTYITSFRGFGHAAFTLAIERTMDKLACQLGLDQLELRLKNAILPGHTSPTQAALTASNVGDLTACITRLRALINWEEGSRIQLDNHKVRAKGIACFWKTSSTPPDAVSGAVVVFNPDGSVNLNVGAAELGQGSKTVLAQILAERLRLDADRIQVNMDVNTLDHPEHWKTVASTATYMAGNAIIAAADDAMRQLKEIAALVLRCAPVDLEVAAGKVYLKKMPQKFIDITEVVYGFMYPNGNAVGGPIIGRGSYIMKHLTGLDQQTGQGMPGPLWTPGAQGVEVEFDTRDCTYRLLKAYTVLDAGKVINPGMARGVVMGGMCMGLSLASRETFAYTNAGVPQNRQLRNYKLLRFGENPEYAVEFVETPATDGPFGARGFGEHGLIGMPAALINCLSTAAGVDLQQLPLTPELIWNTKTGRLS